MTWQSGLDLYRQQIETDAATAKWTREGGPIESYAPPPCPCEGFTGHGRYWIIDVTRVNHPDFALYGGTAIGKGVVIRLTPDVAARIWNIANRSINAEL